MNEATQTVSDYMSTFWQSVIGDGVKKGNAFLIVDKLTELYAAVERTETHIKETYTDPLLKKLHIESDEFKRILQDNGFFKEIGGGSIHIAVLYRSFQNIDANDRQSVNNFITEVNQALDDLLKNSSDAYLNQVKDSTKNTILTVTDFIYYISAEEQQDIKSKVDALINALADWISVVSGLSQDQKSYLISMMQRSDVVISILNPYQQSAESPKRTRYERIEKFKEDLPEAEAKIREGKLPNQKEIKALHLADFFDAGTGFTDIQSYDSVQNISQQISHAIEGVFKVLDKIYAENSAAKDNLDFLKQQIVHWFTMPNDFRPENWIEVIHFVIKNIQYSFESFTYPSFEKINATVLPILDKLDMIFSKVNNDDFKLLLTPKESLGIFDIDIPDIISDEEDTEEEESEDFLFLSQPVEPKNTLLNDSHNTREFYDTNDAPSQEPLTYSSVIEFLCFDEEFGALAKMDKEKGLADVIHNLYYYNWFGSRMYVIESDIYEFVEKNSLTSHWEDIKIQLLDEKGVNIGTFIDFMIDKIVSVVNSLFDFVKETIQYIIAEIFKLAKAIIDFFQKVDLPPMARDLLKQLPPFKKMPNDVTLLHIIAAIPYTLYQEFVSFGVKTKL